MINGCTSFQSLLQVAFPMEVLLVNSYVSFIYMTCLIVLSQMCIFFADDARIYRSINLLSDHDVLQHDIDNLTKWSSDWLLTINPDKCKDLKAATNTLKDYDYVMLNHTLQFISRGKDLERLVQWCTY